MRPSIAANSPISIQAILTDSSEASSTSLLLSFEKSKYLINCPENTSRAFVQSKISTKNVENIILTSPRVDYSGGLHGMLMGLADSNKSNVQVIGPNGTQYILACGRLFTRRSGFNVNVIEFNSHSPSVSIEEEDPFQFVLQDEFIRVFALKSNKVENQELKRKLNGEMDSSSSNNFKRIKLNSNDQLDNNNDNEEIKLGDKNKMNGNENLKQDERLKSIIQDMFRSEKVKQDSLMENEEGGRKRKQVTPAYSYTRLGNPFKDKNNTKTDPNSYLIIGPRLRGKFLPARAKELGIKPGPDFAKLVNGQSIEIKERNQWVTSEMCTEGGSNGSAFLISSISSMDQFQKMKLIDPNVISEKCDGAQLKVVYHLVHEEVLSHPSYIQWISQFNHLVQHEISHSSLSPNSFTFESSALLNLKFSLIYPTSFPIQNYSLTSKKLNLDLDDRVKIKILDRFENFILNSSKKNNNNNNNLKSKINYDFFEDAKRIHDFNVLSNLRSQLNINHLDFDLLNQLISNSNSNPESNSNELSELAKEIIVTTLGTGSAVPSKFRNVSSTLIHIPNQDEENNYSFVLFDVGEGTLGQIKRKFRDENENNQINLNYFFRNLIFIFISHLHADHHSGLFLILKERLKIDGCRPLVLVSQYGVYLNLKEKSQIESIGLSSSPKINNNNNKHKIKWIDSEEFMNSSLEKKDRINLDLQLFLNNRNNNKSKSKFYFNINIVPVIHWGKCFGICLENKVDNWKIVFSGDTRPCQELIEAGKFADVLIHEASLGSDQIELAQVKGHSTIDQAIEVGIQMKAKNCILNHFSNRFPKIPLKFDKNSLNLNLDEKNKINFLVSFDFFTCKLNQIHVLSKLFPFFEKVVVDLKNLDQSDNEDE